MTSVLARREIYSGTREHTQERNRLNVSDVENVIAKHVNYEGISGENTQKRAFLKREFIHFFFYTWRRFVQLSSSNMITTVSAENHLHGLTIWTDSEYMKIHIFELRN